MPDSYLLPENLFAHAPTPGPVEHFEAIIERPGLRIERILSHRHASPPDFWYEQPQDEWVLVAQGFGELEFSDGRLIRLGPGDHLLLPAGCRHRVAATGPDTVWLAVHFDPRS
ncbi:cupin domain-containing protein [Zoogloea sp.]|uniref:cupin domain-containing protein n=1 Tax=Zoogloea sp. TaxID=49181 RepID=UPI0035B17B7A|nr:cupin domain-containing protein [Rhodocyclales bacterium]